MPSKSKSKSSSEARTKMEPILFHIRRLLNSHDDAVKSSFFSRSTKDTELDDMFESVQDRIGGALKTLHSIPSNNLASSLVIIEREYISYIDLFDEDFTPSERILLTGSLFHTVCRTEETSIEACKKGVEDIDRKIRCSFKKLRYLMNEIYLMGPSKPTKSSIKTARAKSITS